MRGYLSDEYRYGLYGELLKLGIQLSQATMAKYMVRQRKPPLQTWKSFLRNHAGQIVAIDFFTVPTVTFDVLSGFVVLSHDRRRFAEIKGRRKIGAGKVFSGR